MQKKKGKKKKSNDHVKKLHFCYISKDCTISHKTFWISKYLYVHEMYMRIGDTPRKSCRQKLGITFTQLPPRYLSASSKLSKMA